MNEKATFSLRGRNPDILTCIANLSNDEVFTRRSLPTGCSTRSPRLGRQRMTGRKFGRIIR